MCGQCIQCLIVDRTHLALAKVASGYYKKNLCMPSQIEEHNLVDVSSDLRSNHVIAIRSPKVLASTKIEVMDLRDANP